MSDPSDGQKEEREEEDQGRQARQNPFILFQAFRYLLLILGLIVIAYYFGIVFIWGYAHLGPMNQMREKNTNVRGEQRALTIALETYCLDHNSYPAWSAEPARNAFGAQARKNAELARMPTFLMAHGTAMKTLTTPVSYVSTYFSDIFAPVKGATYCYWTPPPSNGTGYIVWSPGPDKKYDITLENVDEAYIPAKLDVTPMLVDLSYDPSNGAKSAGDIWRIKE